MTRRTWLRLLSGGLAAAPLAVLTRALKPSGAFMPEHDSNRALAHAINAEKIDALVKSPAEWRTLLPPDAYAVLFEESTERPGSSPLNHEKRKGHFLCAACYLPLFDASAKYESGTGWPSFSWSLPGTIATKTDWKLILPRTEYHCARCGGHQGHVFEDGPAPTGLRFCNNGVALRFVPDGDALPPLRS